MANSPIPIQEDAIDLLRKTRNHIIIHYLNDDVLEKYLTDCYDNTVTNLIHKQSVKERLQTLLRSEVDYDQYRTLIQELKETNTHYIVSTYREVFVQEVESTLDRYISEHYNTFRHLR